MKKIFLAFIIIFLFKLYLFSSPGDSVSLFSENEYVFYKNSFKEIEYFLYDFIIYELRDEYKNISFYSEDMKL